MDTISGAGTIVATAITGPIIDPLTIIRLAIGALIIGQLLCSYLDSGSVDVARPVLAFQDGGECAIRVALAEPNKAKNRLVEPSATISKAPRALDKNKVFVISSAQQDGSIPFCGRCSPRAQLEDL